MYKKRSVFKPCRKLKPKRIDSMAGVRYLANSNKIDAEINYIRRKSAMAYDMAAYCYVR